MSLSPVPLQCPEPAGRSSIDMICVAQASALLAVDAVELLSLVNQDELAVYRLGEQLRFRYRDVESLASRRAIAA